MRVFENRVLRIFGSKRDEVRREWRKLRNEKLNDLYSSPNAVGVRNSRMKFEKNEMGEACNMYGGKERHIQGFGGESSGKKTTWETQA
jgi:hypothetical protein